MTSDTFRLLAAYNAHVNETLSGILTGLSDEEWRRDLRGYYRSVYGLCTHLYIGDFNWLKRFGTLRTFGYRKNPLLDRSYAPGSVVFEDTGRYVAARKELDGLITGFAGELSDDDFGKTLTYRNFRGEENVRNFGGLVLHFFNHQTHHRGMISLYLELLGRENDFSNLLLLV